MSTRDKIYEKLKEHAKNLAKYKRKTYNFGTSFLLFAPECLMS